MTKRQCRQYKVTLEIWKELISGQEQSGRLITLDIVARDEDSAKKKAIRQWRSSLGRTVQPIWVKHIYITAA
jgi:hypothetical protein